MLIAHAEFITTHAASRGLILKYQATLRVVEIIILYTYSVAQLQFFSTSVLYSDQLQFIIESRATK